MSFVQFFVEDALNEAYEILAVRAMNISAATSAERRKYARAARLDLNEFTSKENLLDHVERAYRTGSHCVFFIMDAEDSHFSPDRTAKLVTFAQAFTDLCQHLKNLPEGDALKQMMVVRIVGHSCLECWLLADPPAIVQAFRGAGYSPNHQDTANLNPKQARDQIAHIMREIGRRTGNRKLMKVSGSNIKSEGARIATYVTPEKAAQYNFSLRYFFTMITCTQSGCTRSFPDPT